MKTIGSVKMVYELEFDLQANFTFETSQITTISSKEYNRTFGQFDDFEIPENKENVLFGIEIPTKPERESIYGYLLIETTFELEKFDSLLQGSAKIRPQLIVIHGILSFLTNNIFISFQSFSQTSSIVDKHITFDLNQQLLIAEEVDHSLDLNKIISSIINSSSEKRILIFTLFERWRKALYLEIESEESYVNVDESVLAHVHILEVLADEYKSNLEIKIKEQRQILIRNLIECVTASENKSTKKINSFLNQLNNNQITLKSKVIQMLIDLNLHCPKSENIIVRFIEHRNAIAHGRKDIYQDKAVFPLKPFFSLIKDIDENIDAIKILSAKLISNYLGLEAWSEAWDYVLVSEFVPLTTVKSFLKNESFNYISNKDFLRGEIDEVFPATISYYYLKNKLSFSELEKSVSNIILTSKLTKETCQGLFDTAIPLTDSTNKDLAEKSKKIVRKVYINNWGYFSNIRDILKDHEYHEKKLIWFAEWLTNGKK